MLARRKKASCCCCLLDDGSPKGVPLRIPGDPQRTYYSRSPEATSPRRQMLSAVASFPPSLACFLARRSTVGRMPGGVPCGKDAFQRDSGCNPESSERGKGEVGNCVVVANGQQRLRARNVARRRGKQDEIACGHKCDERD
jgi:hypothetical protein